MPKYQDVKPAHLSEGRTKRNGQLWWYCRKYFVDLSDVRNILLNNSENSFEYFYLIIYDFYYVLIMFHFKLSTDAMWLDNENNKYVLTYMASNN